MPPTSSSPGLCAFFLVGPTASGKSAAAHWIAVRQGAAILSADSMVVYRGLDVGTAKPTPEERAQVRYYGLDLVEPGQPFSAAAYRRAALAAARQAAADGQPLLAVGGTGLYLRSLTDGLAPRAPQQDAIRAEAGRLLAAGGVDALRDWLRRVDPRRLAGLSDPRNPRRLVRALESALAGEAPPAPTWRAAGESPRIPGLMWEPAALYDRIERRVRAMFEGGLLPEVERLLQAGLDRAPTARAAIGYAEAAACLRGACSLEEAMAVAARRTRRLAKRQMTWFRRQANVEWIRLDARMSVSEVAQAVQACWKAHGPAPLAPGE